MKKFLSILFGVVLICFFIGCADNQIIDTEASDPREDMDISSRFIITPDDNGETVEKYQNEQKEQEYLDDKTVEDIEDEKIYEMIIVDKLDQSDKSQYVIGNIKKTGKDKFTCRSSSVYTGEGQSADVKLNGKPLPEGYTVIYKKDNEFFDGNLPQDVGAYEVYVKEGSNEEICIGIFEITSAELDISIKQEGIPKYNGREQDITFSKKSTTVGNAEVTFEYKKEGEES